MIEDEVHPLSKKFLESQGYTSYKGVCNKNGEYGSGDVPVPTECVEKVRIDHQGEKQTKDGYDRLWIEDKGSTGLSTLLEGFTRLLYAIYNGSGDGLLGLPHDMIQVIKANEEFFKRLAVVAVGKGRVGILDVETQKIYEL